MITQDKVKLAFKDIEVLCLNEEYEKANDGWIIEGVEENHIALRSTRYSVIVKVPYALLPERKKISAIKDDVLRVFTFFAKGVEHGVQITKNQIQQNIQEIFALPPGKNKADKVEEQEM